MRARKAKLLARMDHGNELAIGNLGRTPAARLRPVMVCLRQVARVSIHMRLGGPIHMSVSGGVRTWCACVRYP